MKLEIHFSIFPLPIQNSKQPNSLVWNMKSIKLLEGTPGCHSMPISSLDPYKCTCFLTLPSRLENGTTQRITRSLCAHCTLFDLTSTILQKRLYHQVTMPQMYTCLLDQKKHNILHICNSIVSACILCVYDHFFFLYKYVYWTCYVWASACILSHSLVN